MSRGGIMNFLFTEKKCSDMIKTQHLVEKDGKRYYIR
jgi:hypothetical protein